MLDLPRWPRVFEYGPPQSDEIPLSATSAIRLFRFSPGLCPHHKQTDGREPDRTSRAIPNLFGLWLRAGSMPWQLA
jgi:hypothetical protein